MLDDWFYLPCPLGVTVIATCLSNIAASMLGLELRGKIRMEISDFGAKAGIDVIPGKLPGEQIREIASQLSYHIREDPTMAVEATGESIRLLFSVVQ